MRALATIVFFLCAANLFAQQNNISPDTIASKQIQHAEQTLKDSKQKLTRLNIFKKDSTKIDSLKSADKNFTSSTPVSNIADNFRFRGEEEHIMDSVSSPLKKVSDAISGAESKVNQKVSSVNSVPQKLESKLGVPKNIQTKEDSLQRSINTFNKRLSGAEYKIQNKEDSLQNKLTSGVTKIAGKAESKINSVTGEKINVPAAGNLNLSNEKLPLDNNLQLPNASLSEINTKLPLTDSKLPDLNTNSNTQLPNTGDLNINKQVSEIKTEIPSMNTPKLDQLNKVEGLNKVEDVTGEAKQIEGKLAGAEKYGSDLQKLKEGENPEKLQENAEAQLENVPQARALRGQLDKSKQFEAQQQALVQRYRDKKLLQEEIARKATNIANDYLTKNEAAVKQAQAQLAKTKKGVSGIKSVREVFKRKSDELDGKKFYQRLLPGFTFQSFGSKVFTLDLATQIGYRVSPRVTAGVGVTYRTGFDKQFKYFATGLGVYGIRTYFDFAALKGIYVHAEYEYLKINTARFVQPPVNDVNKTFASSSYFGLGKKFNVSRNIKGTVMGLYRVEYEGHLPSMNRVNVRVGFEYVFRKPKKSIVPK